MVVLYFWEEETYYGVAGMPNVMAGECVPVFWEIPILCFGGSH